MRAVLLSGLIGTVTDLMEQNYSGDLMKSHASIDHLLHSQSVLWVLVANAQIIQIVTSNPP